MATTKGLAPGVYVQDKKPLLRPYESASISNLAMFGRITLGDPDPNPIVLTSIDSFARELGGNSVLIGALMEASIEWKNNGPTVTEGFIEKQLIPRLEKAKGLLTSKPRMICTSPIIPGRLKNANGSSQATLATQQKLTTAIENLVNYQAMSPDALPDAGQIDSSIDELIQDFTTRKTNVDLHQKLGQIAVTAWSVLGFFGNGGSRMALFDVESDQIESHLDRLREPHIDAGLVCAPGLTDKNTYDTLRGYCGRRDLADAEGESFCFAILDAPLDKKPDDLVDNAGGAPTQDEAFASHSAACYWPWLTVERPVVDSNTGSTNIVQIKLPPSAFVAGLTASTDRSVGPHQSPAGDDKVIRGASGLSHYVNEQDAGSLNEKGINCLRRFPSGSPVVFGARTLSKDPNYRYIAVARLLLMIRKTIKEQTRWAVFKPNTVALRKSIYRNLYTYLEGLRRQGQLEGEVPEEAFLIVCDDSNNPPSSRQLGVLKVEVHVAPVRPAEFIMVEVTQLLKGAQ